MKNKNIKQFIKTEELLDLISEMKFISSNLNMSIQYIEDNMELNLDKLKSCHIKYNNLKIKTLKDKMDIIIETRSKIINLIKKEGE